MFTDLPLLQRWVHHKHMPQKVPPSVDEGRDRLVVSMLVQKSGTWKS